MNTTTSILVNLAGLATIALVIWWFWLSQKSTEKKATNKPIEIYVDGGIYVPSTIRAQKDKKLKLRFIREDASPCAEVVVFPELGISHELPIEKPFDIDLKPGKSGEFEFTCAMGMYRGKLIVE